mgnify:CR=1 FL=1
MIVTNSTLLGLCSVNGAFELHLAMAVILIWQIEQLTLPILPSVWDHEQQSDGFLRKFAICTHVFLALTTFLNITPRVANGSLLQTANFIGLGLYITKNLVEELGGLISVASKEGVFTNFWFVLPLVQDTPLTRRHVEWMQRQGFKVDLPPEPEAGTEQTEAAEPDAEEGVMNLDDVSDVEYEYYEPNEDDEVEKEFLRTV